MNRIRIHDAFLERFLQALPTDVGNAFRLAYLSLVYRRVYPDPTDPEPLLQRAMSSTSIDDAAKAALAELWNEHRTHAAAICDQMCAEIDKRQFQLASSQRTSGAIEHHNLLAGMAMKRTALNEKFVATLVAHCPGELVSSLDQPLAAWRQSCSEFEASLNDPNAPHGLLD